MESLLVLKAISFAARKHSGQTRKDGMTPYASHPMRVMTIASQVFGIRDPEVLAAAVLHDTIEDTTTDRDDLEQLFGERVAEMVTWLTKDKRLVSEERESKYLTALVNAPLDVRLCKFADMLDNVLDVATMSPEQRKKTKAKAHSLLERLRPGLPSQWTWVAELLESRATDL